MLPCLNKHLTGIDCPGCGLQRSVNLLLHGEFIAAFQMYPAIYPILALLAFLVTSSFVKFQRSLSFQQHSLTSNFQGNGGIFT